jgi:DNA-binding MarR family transcriptional regulator
MASIGRIIRLGRILETRANQALKVHGLIYTDLDVLATLRRSGAPFRLTPTELRNSVLLTSGAMTAAINRLARSHLVRRAKDDRDGRVRWVMLTDRGRVIADHAIEARFAEAAHAVGGISPAICKDLAKSLKALLLSLEALPDTPS